MILAFGSAGGTAIWTAPSLLALIAYGSAALLPERSSSAPSRWVLPAAWLVHAAAITADALGAGAPAGPRFGFAPALSVTAWLVLAVYLIESRFVALVDLRRTLGCIGFAAVGLALFFPGDVHPQAVSRWEPLHWILGIASYALFAVAVLHAALLGRADRQMRHRQRGSVAAAAMAPAVPLLRLERLTFRFVDAGFALLTATLLLGWWFANPWRWDHKTVLSLLGWGVFAGLIAGRRSFGWRGPHASRWLYAGAGLLLLAYVGSRFVLEVVLHRPPAP